MTKFDIELVGKVGSMALINKDDHCINYNVIARISRELIPGFIWVTSGATEIGRIDYINRNGVELDGCAQDNKTDYSAQGQSILMQTYRQFVDGRYSLRQILVEHVHFNNEIKKDYLRKLLLRCPAQNAIPIINYNDPLSPEEIVKTEIMALKTKNSHVVQCVDNDETASQVACLVKTKKMLILTNVDGIYSDFNDKTSLVKEISGKDIYELIENIDRYQQVCNGSSRKGANGAKAKLEYIKEPVKNGTEVIIANSCYSLKDILEGNVNCTKIKVK
ncbi:MAG: uridylate kinase [Clostridia bacterium]